MESNYSNRDFEQFVKQNADEYRMFPSEKVWSGVNNALHTRRRWTGFGLAFLLLLTGGAVSWVMTMYPVSKKSQDIASIKSSNSSTDSESSSNESIATAPEKKKALKKIPGILPFTEEQTNRQSTQADEQPVLAPADVQSGAGLITAEQPSAAAPANTEQVERTEKSSVSLPSARVKHADPAGSPSHNIINTEPLYSPVAISEKTTSREHNITLPGMPEPPLTIESVVNSFKHERERKKISWQIFITPTISYRKLGVNTAFNNAIGSGYPFSPALTDVNKAVTHKPDIGLQLGFTARYPVSKVVNLRGGLQFNVNRYDIKAFSSSGEMATIGLNSPVPGHSSVVAFTRYRNYNGYQTDWLKNLYYSISAPVGVEVKVLGNKKTSFGVAGTIQPTYVISNGAYLISTDYKNYAKVPWLTRNFNMSTGFEAFVNYTRGNTQWQVGPQVRYQLLSSFENKYPVKENLFDFGVKIGVTLNQ
ncbi:hypothetical protein LZZ85_07685 [Terrimonas sp. NA20]|uniref:Outer membrane protein beta-barrel domain-containing protein n=1 Tax=Terrimonas ginsenosidimutans TaxID=2908004 RepID=A0ABS9KPB5_9BACT|nr:hypothetical protein [Terrimonas ginsenosidimutans]MCG2614157.1 hypothetical protein [Terrimonas ginsenosidimutans]